MLYVGLFLGSVLHPGAENELFLSAVLRSVETVWGGKKNPNPFYCLGNC